MTTDSEDVIVTRIPMKLRKRGCKKVIIAPEGGRAVSHTDVVIDNSMIKVIARGRRWQKLLESGEFQSIEDLARKEKINASYITRIARLAFLAPDIIETILEGQHPPDLSMKDLIKPFPMDWQAQRKHFGFVLTL